MTIDSITRVAVRPRPDATRVLEAQLDPMPRIVEQEKKRRARRSFTDEFKAGAVKLALDESKTRRLPTTDGPRLHDDDIDVIMRRMGYNVDAVVNLAKVTARQVRYWDTSGLVRPSLHKARGRGSRRLYSFEDLVELRTVARLLDAGISLQKVRRVAGQIRQVRDVDRPLARLRFLTNGEGVFVASDDTKRWEDVLNGGQVVWIVPLDNVWRETEAAVRRIGAPSTSAVRVGTKTYDVTFEPDLEDGGWVAECPALPGCISQGETLADARRMIRDAIATITAADRPARARVARAP